MITSLDNFMDREYHHLAYNCGHFVVEVWKELTGEDIEDICHAFLLADMKKYRECKEKRKRLGSPESPCIAVMQSKGFHTHAGVFIDGRILHLTENGVRCEPLEILNGQYRMSFHR